MRLHVEFNYLSDYIVHLLLIMVLFIIYLFSYGKDSSKKGLGTLGTKLKAYSKHLKYRKNNRQKRKLGISLQKSPQSPHGKPLAIALILFLIIASTS